MRQDKLSKQNVILYLCGIIPVVWLGLLIAPCLKDGLPGLVQQFGSVMQNPFKIQLCEDSVKTVLTLLWFTKSTPGYAGGQKEAYGEGKSRQEKVSELE